MRASVRGSKSSSARRRVRAACATARDTTRTPTPLSFPTVDCSEQMFDVSRGGRAGIAALTGRPVDGVPERSRRGSRVFRLGEPSHHHEVAYARGGEGRNRRRRDAAGDEDRPSERRGAGDGEPGIVDAGSRPARFGRSLDDGSRRHVVHGLDFRAVELFWCMGRQAHDRERPEDPPSEGWWRVVLSDVDPVRPRFEGEVGTVVQDERDAEIRAHFSQDGRTTKEGPRVERLLAQLHDVDTAGNAIRHESREVRAVRGAEVEMAPSKSAAVGEWPAHRVVRRRAFPTAGAPEDAFARCERVAWSDAPPAALAAAFASRLRNLTSARLSASTMSATERKLPVSPYGEDASCQPDGRVP